MWKGSISFGLVNIPIKLHAATESKDVKFRSLHKKCHTPIKYEKVCPNCEEEVANEDIVKGYEYTKDKFVIIENDELKSLEKQLDDKAVEIIDFVKINDIDPIYFNRSYYLSPNDGGTKAYSLLRKALEKTGKVGIAKIMIRSKEQLACIRVYKNTLVMETIHYPDEVRNVSDVPNVPTNEQITDKELETAILLIDQLTSEFNPENYHDEYREKLLQLIEIKRAGEQVVVQGKQEKRESVLDLMTALQASIDRTKPEKQADTENAKRTIKRKVKVKKQA